tara:strand:- start:23 stop:589 length:567 start_codon:yes stop_codon:yes gene_type:complete
MSYKKSPVKHPNHDLIADQKADREWSKKNAALSSASSKISSQGASLSAQAKKSGMTDTDYTASSPANYGMKGMDFGNGLGSSKQKSKPMKKKASPAKSDPVTAALIYAGVSALTSFFGGRSARKEARRQERWQREQELTRQKERKEDILMAKKQNITDKMFSAKQNAQSQAMSFASNMFGAFGSGRYS